MQLTIGMKPLITPSFFELLIRLLLSFVLLSDKSHSFQGLDNVHPSHFIRAR